MEKSLNYFTIVLAIALLGCEKDGSNIGVDSQLSIRGQNQGISEYYLFKVSTNCPVRAFDKDGELSKGEVEKLYDSISSEANFHRGIHLKPYSEHLNDTTTSIRIYSNDSIYFRNPFAVSGPMWDESPMNIYSAISDGNKWTFTSKDTMVYVGLDEHSATFKMATLIRKHPFAYSSSNSFQERFSAEKNNNFFKFKVLRFAYIYLVYEVDQGFWFNEFVGRVSPSDVPSDDTVIIQEWEYTYKRK